MTKLYDVPRNTMIRVTDCEQVVPPDCKAIRQNDELLFRRIDGMYSYCVDNQGNVVHLAAWTEVEMISPPGNPSLSDGMS